MHFTIITIDYYKPKEIHEILHNPCIDLPPAGNKISKCLHHQAYQITKVVRNLALQRGNEGHRERRSVYNEHDEEDVESPQVLFPDAFPRPLSERASEPEKERKGQVDIININECKHSKKETGFTIDLHLRDSGDLTCPRSSCNRNSVQQYGAGQCGTYCRQSSAHYSAAVAVPLDLAPPVLKKARTRCQGLNTQ